MSDERHPRVGVGVIVLRGDKVLLGRRRGAHGEGTWQFPGGHLDWFETVEACARREVFEETGMVVDAVRPARFTNDHFEKEGLHYVTLFVMADHVSGEAELREPDQCERWEWVSWGEFPEPLFVPIRNLLVQGFDPFPTAPRS